MSTISFGNTVSSLAGGANGEYGISAGNGVVDVVISGNTMINAGSISPIYIHTSATALCFGNNETTGETNQLHVRGVGNPEFAVRVAGANADIVLTPQGAGVIRFNYASQVGSTPASFSADRIIQLKDSAGAVHYVPAMLSAW